MPKNGGNTAVARERHMILLQKWNKRMPETKKYSRKFIKM